MSAKFRRLAEGYWVSPQITPEDVGEAAAMGVKLIINNRPDGEEAGQPRGAEIEQAAKALGVSYAFIPVSGMNIGQGQVDLLAAALAGATGPVLAFCRSGTRSTVLRAFVEARSGGDIDSILEEAANAGYDLSGQRHRLEAVARVNNE